MARALVTVGAGPPLLWPFPPFGIMAYPGDSVWDDDPLIFGTAQITPDRRAAHGIIPRDPPCSFHPSTAEGPTNRVSPEADAVYAALGYDRAA